MLERSRRPGLDERARTVASEELRALFRVVEVVLFIDVAVHDRARRDEDAVVVLPPPEHQRPRARRTHETRTARVLAALSGLATAPGTVFRCGDHSTFPSDILCSPSAGSEVGESCAQPVRELSVLMSEFVYSLPRGMLKIRCLQWG